MVPSPFFYTVVAGLSTGLGGVLAAAVRPSRRALDACMGFAAGVMLAISLADLAPAAIGFYGSYLTPAATAAAVALLLGLGAVLAALLSRLLPEEAALAKLCRGDGQRTAVLRAGLAVAAALVLHNLPEGVLTLFSGAADPALGRRTALAVALHNIPEGLAIAAPLAWATGKRWQAVGAALASGLAEPLGALLAWGLLRGVLTPALLNGTVAVVAGVMLWVALAELLPQALRAGRAGAAGAAAGCLTMLLGVAVLG
mgnify:FL=1